MQSLSDIWDTVMDRLRSSGDFSETSMELWFGDIKLAKLTDTSAILVNKSDFKRDIVEKKYTSVISEALGSIIGFPVNIYIGSDEHGDFDADNFKPPERSAPVVPEHKEVSELPPQPTRTNIKSGTQEFTFDNFIVGNTNKFAHAACIGVANSPAQEYNPLFIYGPSGIGKTHLLHAITYEIKQNYPNYSIIYVKGEEFTNQMTDSLRLNTPNLFRDKFRNADVLLIDDIQFIAGKYSIQEEFFHTFNSLYDSHKQIILTSDRPPKDINPLTDRLKSRFEWGLLADIQPPDYALRVAIIKSKSQLYGIEIPNNVCDFLAERLDRNIRQLEGAIKKIGAKSFLTGLPITEELAGSCITDLMTSTQPAKVIAELICEVVSKKYGVSIDELKGNKQSKEISAARQICIYVTRKITDMSLPDIGKIYSRNHSTVLSSIRKIENLTENNSAFAFEIEQLISEIKS